MQPSPNVRILTPKVTVPLGSDADPHGVSVSLASMGPTPVPLKRSNRRSKLAFSVNVNFDGISADVPVRSRS
jgi:hypothetical protein